MKHRDCCARCHKPFGNDVYDSPMLLDDVWQRLADPREKLCFSCLLDRATERQVHLSVASLKPCPVNLFHRPHSWFDFFMQDERDPPPNIDEWNRAMDDPTVDVTWVGRSRPQATMAPLQEVWSLESGLSFSEWLDRHEEARLRAKGSPSPAVQLDLFQE